ncbi:GMC oxidoreductase [Mycena leptocephala]|nr:GMC oxidoreductase [Mycena leptocephala]
MSAAQHDVSGKMFDYVIIGGGTAGLALASRLSEDPSVTVAVIEAGDANLGDPNILVPGQFEATFTNPKYDWAFPTEKQIFSNEKEFIWSRGKGLGGSSGMNFCAWVKPPVKDVDAIEKLGNPGWNWKEYLKYSQRSETFHPPAQEQMNLYPHTYEVELRGTSGPIHTTIPFHHHAIDVLFQQTLVNKGLKSIKAIWWRSALNTRNWLMGIDTDNKINGTWIANANLDPRTWTRSYSATGYFLPAQDRPNLTILTEATVTRILFNDTIAGQKLTAKGVEFVHNKCTCEVNAKYEVILSAGTIQSPQILELSGIGRPEILRKIGVEMKIKLDGVGENIFGVSFELAGSPETYDRMRDPKYKAETLKLHGEGRGPQRVGITSFAYFPLSAATAEAPALIERAAAGLTAERSFPPGLQEQFDLQFECLRRDDGVDLEIVAFPGFFTAVLSRIWKLLTDFQATPEPDKSYVTILSVLNHPLSRRTIHAKRANPFDLPSIDPRYFENDFGKRYPVNMIDVDICRHFSNLEILVQHIKYIRTMVDIEPFQSGVVREVDPGPNYVTDQDIRDCIKNNHGTSWHTVGSCSMLPREKRGVVDPELKVYGTNNLRIVDISIVPIHIAAHTHGQDQIKTAAKIPAPSPIANLSAPTAVGRAALEVLTDDVGPGALGEGVPGLLEGRLMGAVALPELDGALDGAELGVTLEVGVLRGALIDVLTEVVRDTEVETETEEDRDEPDLVDAEAEDGVEEMAETEREKVIDLPGC